MEIRSLSLALSVLFSLRSCLCPVGFPHRSLWGKLLKRKGSRLVQIVEFEFEGDVLLPSVSVLCNPFDPPGSYWGTTDRVSYQVCLPKELEPLRQLFVWYLLFRSLSYDTPEAVYNSLLHNENKNTSSEWQNLSYWKILYFVQLLSS